MGKGNEDESEACEFEMIALFFTVLLLGNLLGVGITCGVNVLQQGILDQVSINYTTFG